MKKYIKYISFAIISFISLTTIVFAEDASLNLQCDEGIINVFKIGGYVLFIIKIIVPLLLIIFASIDMFKAVIGNDSDMIKKQTQVILRRSIAAIVIFLLPTLINFAFTALTNFNTELEKYGNLATCLEKPGTCEVPTTCP